MSWSRTAFELSLPKANGTGHELETFTLVGPLDDEQGGHEAMSPRLGCEVASESRSDFFQG